MVYIKNAYRTRANRGRAYYSKIIVLALRLSHKKHRKNVFLHDFLGGRLLIKRDRYWREHGTLSPRKRLTLK